MRFSFLLPIFVFGSLLSGHASEPPKVYVFPGRLLEKPVTGVLEKSREALKEELLRRYDQDDEVNYRELLAHVISETTEKELKLFVNIDCREKCLEAVRGLLEKLQMESMFILTVSQQQDVTRLQLMLADHKDTRIETAYCEKCELPEIRKSVVQLVSRILDEKTSETFADKVPQRESVILTRVLYGWGNFSNSQSSLMAYQFFWEDWGIGQSRWNFSYDASTSVLELNTLSLNLHYQIALPPDFLLVDLGGEGYDLTVGLGFVTGGEGEFQRSGYIYSSESVSGFDLSGLFGQQHGNWEWLLGICFHSQYIYDMSASGSSLVYDRNVSWADFLIGAGWIF